MVHVQPSLAQASMSTLSTGKINAASTYRNLVFGGSVPLAIRVASEDLSPNADRAIDCFYVRLLCLCDRS